MATTTAKATTKTGSSDRSIDPTRVYPLPTFMEIVGWGRFAMRSARRDGLKVVYRGGRAFVRGADFDEFLKSQEPIDVRGTCGIHVI